MRKEPEEVEKEGNEKQENTNGAEELGGRNTHETDRKRPATPCQCGAAGWAPDWLGLGPTLEHDRLS